MKYEKIYKEIKEEFDNFDGDYLFESYLVDNRANYRKISFETWLIGFFQNYFNLTRYMSKKIYDEYY